MRRSLALASVGVLAGAVLTGIATPASATPASATPASATPASAGSEPISAVARAEQALSLNPGAVRASSADRFTVSGASVDPDGAAHVRYARTYQGLRVLGGDFVVHTKAGGGFAGASVGLTSPLALGVKPAVSAATARSTARDHFAGAVTGAGAAELFVDATSGLGRLAWETVVSGWAADGQTPSRLHVIVDALTGAVLWSFDEVRHVNGTGNSIYAGTVTISTTKPGSTYSMIDPTHGNGTTCDMNNGTGTCTTFTDANNVWGNGAQSSDQSAAVDAHYGAAKTFDYFKNVHGRNGIFGNGAGVPSRVHYGNNYVNAFWDGTRMTYGDGAGNAKPLVSLDVAGHEMSHGVTAAVSGLVYSGESGGLNEATSDIFGNMVEFFANNSADPGDYLVGEKININGNGTPLRWMYNPPLDGHSHGCWSTSTKNVDVHYSSGVANHFFFNLAQGTGSTPFGTSPKCGSVPTVVGIGRAKAEKIWWRALNTYFTSTTRYVNTANPGNTARADTLAAAKDLHGLCSTEYKAVQAAWTAVNVAGNDAVCSGAPGTCTASNNNPLTASTITISGCPGNGSATSKVLVKVTNPNVFVLKVTLTAPDGSVYLLDSSANGNFTKTYTVNLSNEPRNGAWRLSTLPNGTLVSPRFELWEMTWTLTL